MNCFEHNCFHKFDSFNRLPWLNVRIENTKDIANGLLVQYERRDFNDRKNIKIG